MRAHWRAATHPAALVAAHARCALPARALAEALAFVAGKHGSLPSRRGTPAAGEWRAASSAAPGEARAAGARFVV